MDYALAKELKDAAFPQGGKGSWIYPSDILVTRPADRLYVPTLSELIEACGPQFMALLKHDDGSGWTALSGDILFNAERNALGSMPEEAVARLYLALHPRT